MYSEEESGNENEYKGSGRYVIDDPDLIESDVDGSVYGKPISPPGTPPPPSADLKEVIDNVVSDCQQDEFDTKGMVEYKVNWLGWLFSLGAVGYYGRVLFDQMKIQLPTIYDDMMPINLAFKLRYIGVFGYFLTCILRPSFIFECRNAEAPLIVSTVMELYYLLSYKERNEAPPFVFELFLPVAVSVACFLRRKPYLRMLMNPWTKDKSELMRIIQVFRSSKTNDKLVEL